MNRADQKALHDCLRLYRARGPRERAEIDTLIARHGRERAWGHACIRIQAINLGLGYFRLVPAELSPTSPARYYTGQWLVVIAPPLRNGGFAALGAREAPNDEARVHETGPAGPS